jgi:SOS response regulatory protein OraA/RecX
MILKIEIKKDAVILIDGEEKWRTVNKSLFLNELKKFSKGISREEFSALEQKVAKNHAFFLLSQRSLLSAQLESKLLEKGISPECAKKTVELCSEKGYLNDDSGIERFFARELRKGRSAKAAYFKIKRKAGSIDLREHYEQALTSERESLKRYIEKNQKKINRSDPKEMRKWAAKLCRQGFTPEMVLRELAPKEF